MSKQRKGFVPYETIQGGRYAGCSIEQQDGSFKVYDDRINCGALIAVEDSLKDALNAIDDYWQEYREECKRGAK